MILYVYMKTKEDITGFLVSLILELLLPVL